MNIRVSLSFDVKTQVLSSTVIDCDNNGLVACIVIAYDQNLESKVAWTDVLLSSRDSNQELKDLVKQDSGSLVGGVFLKYLADCHSENTPLEYRLQGASHPLDILLSLGDFSIYYDIDSPHKLVELAKFFSAQDGPVQH